MTETTVDIQTSEIGYYLIAELVTMPDRVLAQKIELAVWNRCAIPNEPILCKIIEILKESDDPIEFYATVMKYVDSLPIRWQVAANGHVTRD